PVHQRIAFAEEPGGLTPPLLLGLGSRFGLASRPQRRSFFLDLRQALAAFPFQLRSNGGQPCGFGFCIGLGRVGVFPRLAQLLLTLLHEGGYRPVEEQAEEQEEQPEVDELSYEGEPVEAHLGSTLQPPSPRTGWRRSGSAR